MHAVFMLSLLEELVWEVLLTEFVLIGYSCTQHPIILMLLWIVSRPSYQCSHVCSFDHDL